MILETKNMIVEDSAHRRPGPGAGAHEFPRRPGSGPDGAGGARGIELAAFEDQPTRVPVAKYLALMGAGRLQSPALRAAPLHREDAPRDACHGCCRDRSALGDCGYREAGRGCGSHAREEGFITLARNTTTLCRSTKLGVSSVPARFPSVSDHRAPPPNCF